MLGRRIIGGVLATLMTAAAAWGGAYQVHPSITVGEEYTDNVYDRMEKRTDFITRVMPGIALEMKTPVLEGDLGYLLDYRWYARNSMLEDTVHTASARGHLTLAENLLFLDLSDEYRRVSLDVTNDVTNESLVVRTKGQSVLSDRNQVTASPYLTLGSGGSTTTRLGYRFVDTRYFDSQGIDKMVHAAFVETSHAFTPGWSGLLGYSFTRDESDIGNINQHQGHAGFRYEYAEKSFVTASGGSTWSDFSSGESHRSLYWNVGLSYQTGKVTGTVTSGVNYTEDPLGNVTREALSTANLEMTLTRGAAGVGFDYAEFASVDTGQVNTRKYTARAKWHNELGTGLSGRIALTADHFQYLLRSTHTRRLQLDTGLVWQLTREVTGSLGYIGTDYCSPGDQGDNRSVNRCMLELKYIY